MEQQLILDRYRPLEELGEGGYGSVVLAYDTRIQRRVAIKRLPTMGVRSRRETTPSGLVEARTAALLNHPAIVTVHEWDTDSDEAFIIMEFVDGASLADILDAEGALSTDQAAAVLEAVSSAIAFAHDNGVLHLDIKPENVLITRDGRVKVADFGVSTLSTAVGHGVAEGGTLGYMPPEQLSAGEVDERTDEWALASVMYECLTDANPFGSDTIEGALFKAEIVEPAPPSEFTPDLPAGVDDVLFTALLPHPDDRYADVGLFAAALTPLLGDPLVGTEELADSVCAILGDETPSRYAPGPGLWDRLARRSGLVVRLWAAVAAAWLTWMGLAQFDLGLPAQAGGTALIALAAALAPSLGMLLGLAAFSVGLFAFDAPWLAGGFAALSALYWWFVGRRSAGAAAGPLSGPVLGVAHAASASPLLLGFALTPLKAAAASAMSAALTMLAAAASGSTPPYLAVGWKLLIDPWETHVTGGSVKLLVSSAAPLAMIAAWAVAGAAMSIACHRASRTAALAGAALGTGAMVGGGILAHEIAVATGAIGGWSGANLAQELTASLILVVLVVAVGAPTRAEEE